MPEVNLLVKEVMSKHEASIKKFRVVLEKQINEKIINSYMKRDEDMKILKKCSETMGDLCSIIHRSNKGDFETEATYMGIYRKLINIPGDVFHEEEEIKTMK